MGFAEAERLQAYPASQPELQELMKEADRLIRRHHKTKPALHPWRNAISIAERCSLGEYDREADLLALYRQRFRSAVLKYYPSMSACVLARLGWDLPPDPPLPSDLQSFSSTLTHQAHVRVVANEWPYGVEEDVSHFVIWSRLPIFHASQSPTEREIECGYSGFSWRPEADSPASVELGRFIRQRWDPSKYEIIWFANPPALQTIPVRLFPAHFEHRLESEQLVSHFHALVRSKKGH